eukprot:1021117-Prymnesium_polylepis.1
MDDAIGDEPQPTKHKHSSSKYDFVKVRVWLKDRTADGSEHYYVLSRFLVSRMLAVTQMQYRDSIRLALELKKRLVDRQVRARVCGLLVRACVARCHARAQGAGADALSSRRSAPLLATLGCCARTPQTLDVSQEQMEAELFELMRANDYGG